MSEDEVLAVFGSDFTFSPAEADHLFDLNSVTDKPDSRAPYFTSVLAAHVMTAKRRRITCLTTVPLG